MPRRTQGSVDARAPAAPGRPRAGAVRADRRSVAGRGGRVRLRRRLVLSEPPDSGPHDGCVPVGRRRPSGFSAQPCQGALCNGLVREQRQCGCTVQSGAFRPRPRSPGSTFALAGGHALAGGPAGHGAQHGAAACYPRRPGMAHRHEQHPGVHRSNSAQGFYEQLLAFKPDPASGKPDPAAVQDFLARHPETERAMKLIRARAVSSSFTDSTFNGLDAFRMVVTCGTSVPVPVGHEERCSSSWPRRRSPPSATLVFIRRLDCADSAAAAAMAPGDHRRRARRSDRRCRCLGPRAAGKSTRAWSPSIVSCPKQELRLGCLHRHQLRSLGAAFGNRAYGRSAPQDPLRGLCEFIHFARR